MKKRWKWAAYGLLMVCLSLVLTAAASAADVVNSGTCGKDGDNLTWTLDSEGTLTISGTGEMADYLSWDTRSIKTVIIEAGVTSIGNNAFSQCRVLTAITIPDSVFDIGGGAFEGCSSLVSITLPDSVTSIGSSAFSGCSSLTSIILPDSLSSIGIYVFKNCSSLTSITIPDSLSSIGNSTFEGCSNLTSITIPDSVSSIGSSTFKGCSSLTSIAIPNSITSIDEAVFRDCSSLVSITLPDGVTSIGNSAFHDCNSLVSITLPDGVTSIGNYAFCGCSGLTSITLPNGVISIGNYAFYDCSSLASITLPDGVTSIGKHAFYDCSSLTSITLPDSLSSIGNYAFYGCRSLTGIHIDANNMFYCSIDGVLFDKNKTTLLCYPGGKTGDYRIPNNVSSIGNYAFNGCRSLTSITLPDGVTSIGGSAFYDCSSLTFITLPDGVTSIGGSAFYGCSSLTFITLPDSLSSIGDYAFRNCSSLTDIYYIGTQEDWSTIGIGNDNNPLLNANIHYIVDGGTCGKDGNNLTWMLDWKETLTISGTGAMADYSVSNLPPWGNLTIKIVVIEAGVTNIGDYAFYDCDSLTDVYYIGTQEDWGTIGIGNDNNPLLNANIYYIVDSGTCGKNGSNPTWTLDSKGTLTISGTREMKDYYGNAPSPWDSSAIKTVVIETGVTSIGNYAFEGCSSLTNITIPDSVTTIGDYAFDGCSSLPSITLPDSVTTIGRYAIGRSAFYDCSSLTAITVDTNNMSYCSIDGVLFDKSEITLVCCPAGKTGDYSIPDSVTTIGDCAFGTCSSLTNITIPDSVTTIGDYAFYECSSLTSITLPDSVSTISNHAFQSCWKLTNITIPDSITTIGDCAFGTCSSLTNITIPDSVTTIGDYAFYECSSLTAITLPDSVTTIGSSAFAYCSSLTTITVDVNNMSYCSIDGVLLDKSGTILMSWPGGKTEDYSIPDSVTTIGDYAFSYCRSLPSITIPDSVTTIGDSAFQSCSSLTAITIPDSVTTIGNSAFSYCSSLTDIYYSGAEEEWNAIEIGTKNNPLLNARIHYNTKPEPDIVDEGTCGDNLTWTLNDEGTLTISGTEEMMNNPSWDKSAIKTVVMEAGATNIGSEAFRDCNSLTSITLPDSVSTIGNSAFEGCSSLTSITLPDNISYIDDKAFYGCDSLTDVYYGGTQEDWNAITMGIDNAPLLNARIHYHFIKAVLVDADDQEITSSQNLPKNGVTVKVSFDRDTEAGAEIHELTVILALYSSSGQMLGCNPIPLGDDALQNGFTQEIDTKEPDIGSIKLIVVNQLEDMTPLCAAKELL